MTNSLNNKPTIHNNIHTNIHMNIHKDIIEFVKEKKW